MSPFTDLVLQLSLSTVPQFGVSTQFAAVDQLVQVVTSVERELAQHGIVSPYYPTGDDDAEAGDEPPVIIRAVGKPADWLYRALVLVMNGLWVRSAV